MGRLPITHQQRINIIHTMVLPAALYGSEVSHCPAAELKALRTAIVNTLGPKSTTRSVPLIMELCGGHREVDPQVCLLTRKLTLLRRILAKYPSTATKVQSLLCAYNTQHRPGTPAGRSNTQPRHLFGPISHLLHDLAQAQATINRCIKRQCVPSLQSKQRPSST